MPSVTQVLNERAELIKAELQVNDRLLERAIEVLYEHQTADEQATLTTTEDNGVGFTAFDAEFLSSLGERIKRNLYRQLLGNRLTDRQREVARRKIGKYAKQLARLAIAKEQRDGAVPVTAAVVEQTPIRQRGGTIAPTMFDSCPECHGSLRVDRSTMGEHEEQACPRCCGTRVEVRS
jgi:hypothetical protein